MKVVQINVSCGQGSTGKICIGISEVLKFNHTENYILYSVGKSDYSQGIKYTNEKYIKFQALKSRIFGNYGFNSTFATKRIIKKLEDIQPSIIHLHNMHGHNCNMKKLFNYIKKKNIHVIWTFHDCWAFTGYCPHFIMQKCERWKSKCYECPQFRKYSWFNDKSSELYLKKKALIDGIDITVATPSKWLKEMTKGSFFKDCKIKVINNGIDLSLFKPRQSNIKEKYSISNEKHIILGVAFDWGVRKGLDTVIHMADTLDQKKYQIVLVGTNQDMDVQLPKQIISIHRTYNQLELAEIYSVADVFINPTREDTFPTVNLEALACGTPVVTFNTGGSPECIDETCGSVVEVDDFEGLKNEIIRICETKPYSEEACIKRARQFDQNDKYLEYYELYKEVLNSKE